MKHKNKTARFRRLFLSSIAAISLLLLICSQFYQASFGVVPNFSVKDEDITSKKSVSINNITTNNYFQCDSIVASECCALWDIDGDDWWLRHPDWQVSRENATTFCFQPIQDETKANFMKNLHELQQWAKGNCSQVEKTVHISSGFGASKAWLLESFWHAYKHGKPFQLIHGKRKWLYATNDTDSWAYCPSRDTRCYYLPVSPCSRIPTKKGEHEKLRVNRNSTKEVLQYHWLSQYLFRPRQIFRRKVWEMTQQLDIKQPCTTMHVRRADAGLPKAPYRRYAAVQEYIDAAQIPKGDNIVLLTDDQSTVEEVKKYHADDYHWIYLERVRNRGIWGGFDGHIPSKDEGLEMVVIETELRAASACDKIVHGLSGFMKHILMSMDLEGRNYTRYYVNTAVSKEEATKFGRDKDARIRSFFQDMKEKRKETDPPLPRKVSGVVSVEKKPVSKLSRATTAAVNET